VVLLQEVHLGLLALERAMAHDVIGVVVDRLRGVHDPVLTCFQAALRTLLPEELGLVGELLFEVGFRLA